MALQRNNTRFQPARKELSPESEQSTDTRSSHANDSTNKLRKKRSIPNQDDAPSVPKRRIERDRGDAAPSLGTPRRLETGFRTEGYVETKKGLPWGELTQRFELKLNVLLTIASRDDKSLVAVRRLDEKGDAGLRKVDILREVQRKVRHKNFVALVGCFTFDKFFYVILEHDISEEETLAITLSQFARVSPCLDEPQLAGILKQILKGVQYLHSIDLMHGSLTCENILMGNKGSVKITGQECCSRIEPGQRSDVDTEYISRIAEELMVKEPKVKPLPSPKRPGDWPVEWPDGCAADNFRLAALSGNYSVTTLLNHPLFREEVDIRWIEQMAEVSVFRGMAYLPDKRKLPLQLPANQRWNTKPPLPDRLLT